MGTYMDGEVRKEYEVLTVESIMVEEVGPVVGAEPDLYCFILGVEGIMFHFGEEALQSLY